MVLGTYVYNAHTHVCDKYIQTLSFAAFSYLGVEMLTDNIDASGYIFT